MPAAGTATEVHLDPIPRDKAAPASMLREVKEREPAFHYPFLAPHVEQLFPCCIQQELKDPWLAMEAPGFAARLGEHHLRHAVRAHPFDLQEIEHLLVIVRRKVQPFQATAGTRQRVGVEIAVRNTLLPR